MCLLARYYVELTMSKTSKRSRKRRMRLHMAISYLIMMEASLYRWPQAMSSAMGAVMGGDAEEEVPEEAEPKVVFFAF